MIIKVIVDSNVLIASSVYVTYVKDFNSPFKHEFFDDATHLTGLLKKHIGTRVGVITNTIENEVHGVFNKSVLDTLRECRPNATKEQLYEFLSIVLNKCEDRLSDLLAVMMREPVLPNHKAPWIPKVEQMYDELIQQARDINIQDIAYKKAGGSSKRYKPEAYNAILEDEEDRHIQLKRLLMKSAGRTDREILAEATYLYSFYKQYDDVKFYLASCDLSFSPTGPDFCSHIVTDEIFNRFNIICHWPSEVAKELQRNLK